MEEEKETAEEKEEEEEEKDRNHVAATSSVDSQDLPIIHWEDLSVRIAELERQEQERRERSKGATESGTWRRVWEEEEENQDLRRCRVAVVSSRFHHTNLQLCFINNSDSEDEEGGANTKVSMGTGRNGCHATGLKQEVVTALRTLRDKLMAEQREEDERAGAGSGNNVRRKHLESWELKECSVQQLHNLRVSLQQDVHALSSELVTHLLVRDQLRTKQDAMLLDVQDLT